MTIGDQAAIAHIHHLFNRANRIMWLATVYRTAAGIAIVIRLHPAQPPHCRSFHAKASLVARPAIVAPGDTATPMAAQERTCRGVPTLAVAMTPTLARRDPRKADGGAPNRELKAAHVWHCIT